jgi:hypothetical protein
LYPITLWLAVFAVLLSGLAMPWWVSAQDEDEEEEEFVPATIEITGAIISIDGAIIIVSGLPADTSGAAVEGELTVGVVVVVSGVINEEGVIIAETVRLLGAATPTPEATPAPTLAATPTPPDPDTIIVVEGPVQNININIITIYNINIIVAPENPILNFINIGDVIRVEGAIGNNGVINAIVVNTIIQIDNAAPGATVSVQGPVESINGNIIIVNGITIQLDPNDPLLVDLEIGNFIDVQGNFTIINNVYVLVVVNVVIINNTYIGVPPYCVWYGMGMGIGHWRCDTYWVYPPDYWYCEWRGMGMGMGMGMGRFECRNPAPGMGMGMGMGR